MTTDRTSPLPSALSPEKLDLLAKRIEQARSWRKVIETPAIPKRQQLSPAPLSFAQQRLWFLDQLEPNSPLYNLPLALRLQGELQPEALRRTLTEIRRRHESLRTRFEAREGVPAQVIDPPQEFVWVAHDLSWMKPDEREREVLRLAGAEARRPFDLARGPLWRASLLRVAENEYVALFTMSHIVSDGWSMGVLVKEVAALYTAYLRGEDSPLPELPIQYADYAVWQRAWMSGETLEKQLRYWRKQLAGAPAALELPTDRSRPAVETHLGGSYAFKLPQDLSAALMELSQSEGVTLFMTLLAAFKVLLGRYSGQEDLVVGTPIANRTRAETEGLIGFFVNQLVLRTDLSGEPSFRQLLGRVREVCLGAYGHQDAPFEKLVEELQPERDLSRSPLFQVMVVLQNAPMGMLGLPGLRLSEITSSGERFAKFEMTLTMQEGASGIAGELEYNSELLDEATVGRMLSHYERLLIGIAADIDQRLHELSLLSDIERRQILVGWNETSAEYPKNGYIPQLFETQAECAPDAVALVYGAQEVSYGTLNKQANRLAHHLRKLGVGPEVLVAVCAERSLEMVVSLLAILKAGGAYAPLDPDYPDERLEFMLEDSRPSALLVQGARLEGLPACAPHVLRLDDQWEKLDECEENPVNLVESKNPAYVIFTSGSTGRPKGVMNSHGGIRNQLLWRQAAYHLTAEDRVLQKTPFSFDVSVWEFFWPLLSGACLVIADPGGHRDSAYIVRLIVEKEITTLHFVPSMLQAFLQEKDAEKCRSVKRVICSGEALPFELQERFFAVSSAELHNLYGPTEAAIDVTFHACERASERRIVPIGRPVANTQLYVLDNNLNPIPGGVPGELYIGGEGLARGYFNRPDLTAERFIPNLFGDEPGQRLYRTGDLARYLDDGDLEFLGRADHQVKIRGYRIELGEIEAALRRHSGVSEAVVIAEEDGNLEKRLVAYLVSRDGLALSDGELRGFLKQRLPEYMAPSFFVILKRLPLTPNGKVDRRALPSPNQTGSDSRSYTAPRNEIENVLVSVWQKALGVSPIGIHDNYFALGGNSIRVIQVVHDIRRYNPSITVMDVLRNPTVYQLAIRIREIRPEQPGNGPPLLELAEPPERRFDLLPSDAEDVYRASKMQIYLMSHYSNDRQQAGVYHIQQSYHMRDEEFSLAAFKKALEITARRHPALRTTFIIDAGGEPIQVVRTSDKLPFQVKDLNGLNAAEQGEYIDAFIKKDRASLFDVSNPDEPLLRLTVFLRSETTFEFFMAIHHALFDGWSNQALLKELAESYLSCKRSEDVDAVSAVKTYKEFVALEREIIASAGAKKFWDDHLRNHSLKAPPKRPSLVESTETNFICALDPELVDHIRKLSRNLGVSLKAVFLSAFLDLIGSETGEEIVTVGVVANGRSERLSDPLNAVGLFWNLIPFCCAMGSGDKIARVKLVQQLLIDAEAFAAYPLPQILEDRQVDELFFATFNFLHFHNLKDIPINQGLSLLGVKSHDKFHFPLNFIISVDPFNEQISFRVEYDQSYFNGQAAQDLTARYADLLAPDSFH